MQEGKHVIYEFDLRFVICNKGDRWHHLNCTCVLHCYYYEIFVFLLHQSA